jgi:APA family basic amino acid/polyamine antiporter
MVMQPAEQTMPPVRQAENAQRHEQGLSFLSLTSLVIASMIGAGVFTTSGFALGDLGTPGRVMLAWLVGGGVALCGALSYGALARRMTASGGEYLFLSRAIHPAVGFLAGWVSLLAGFTGSIAFAARAFAAYAQNESQFPAIPSFRAALSCAPSGLLDWLPCTVLENL